MFAELARAPLGVQTALAAFGARTPSWPITGAVRDALFAWCAMARVT
jgi:hypothetical protein